MSDVIVDTNVIVVANDQNNEVVGGCRDSCVEFIARAGGESVVLLDRNGEILSEYLRAVERESRPQLLGARFVIKILQEQGNIDRVKFVDLDKTDSGEFVDFPDGEELADFDPSDRKFAALAKKKATAVTNATDSDWADHKQALSDNGIGIEFLCGCVKTEWFQ